MLPDDLRRYVKLSGITPYPHEELLLMGENIISDDSPIPRMEVQASTHTYNKILKKF